MNRQNFSTYLEENYSRFKFYLKNRFYTLSDYDIEDIVQQTILKLLYKGDDLLSISNLSVYINRSLHNNAIDFFKANHRYSLHDEMPEQLTLSTEDEILLLELKEVMKQAIFALDVKSRYVFVETELKGRSYDSLIAESGIKLGTLLSRKSRAKKKLQKSLLEYLGRL